MSCAAPVSRIAQAYPASFGNGRSRNVLSTYSSSPCRRSTVVARTLRERPIAWRERYRLGAVGMIREHLLKGTLINQHARNQPMREVASR